MDNFRNHQWQSHKNGLDFKNWEEKRSKIIFLKYQWDKKGKNWIAKKLASGLGPFISECMRGVSRSGQYYQKL